MILTDVKSYLKAKHQVSLQELCQCFDCSTEAMRGMLTFLMGKGLVDQTLQNSACGTSCSKCAIESVEIYQWKQ